MPSVRGTKADGGNGGQLRPIVQSLAAQHGGNRYAIGDGAVLLGRDAECGIVYQEGTKGVSRKHCAITWDDEKNCFVIMDLGSSYGTYLENGIKIEPRKAYYLKPGDSFYLADKANMIRLDADNGPTGNAYTSTDESVGVDAGQGAGRKKAAGEPKSKKQRILTIAIAAAAIVVLVPLFCLVAHLTGNSRMNKGDYTGAVTAYRLNFLYGKSKRIEAALEAGEAFYEERDYASAAEYFLLAGEDGAERYVDALCARAAQLTEEGDSEAALELLQDYTDDTRVQEQIALVQLAVAEKLLNSGDVDKAIETAKAVEKIGSADPEAFLNKAYLKKADVCLAAGNYEGAAEAYESCQGEEKAQKDAEILRTILKKDWFTAAEMAAAAVKDTQSNKTGDEWSDIFWGAFGEIDSADVNQRLARGAVKAILRQTGERSESEWKTAISSALSLPKAMVGNLPEWDSDRSELDFTKSCGADAKGKVLFVMKTWDYPKKNRTQAVLYDLMDLLPEAYYPRSLDEVEYLITISFDNFYECTYDVGTDGLREFVRVDMLRLPRGWSLYDSGTVYGDHAPDTLIYSGTAPAWETGGAPDPTEYVYKALMAAMK